MALNPNFQRRAQAELDAVIGPGGLPDFNHKTDLPFVHAIVKDTLRWQPVLHAGQDFIPF